MNRVSYYFSNGIVELYNLLPLVNRDGKAFIEKALTLVLKTFAEGGKVLICGNGGSACDAMHFAEELTGRFRKDRKALPAIALTDPSHLTCVGNDYGFEYVFSRSIEALGGPNDVLIALSTSGNSRNVQLAVEQAKGRGMRVVCLLGKSGGFLNGQGDAQFIVPSQSTERIQEIHTVILHLLVEAIERELFPENYEV